MEVNDERDRSSLNQFRNNWRRGSI
jgi:hypothetical protein